MSLRLPFIKDLKGEKLLPVGGESATMEIWYCRSLNNSHYHVEVYLRCTIL